MDTVSPKCYYETLTVQNLKMSSFLAKLEKTVWPDPEGFREAPLNPILEDPPPPAYMEAYKAQIGRVPEEDTITIMEEKICLPTRKGVPTEILCVSALAVLIIIVAEGGVMRTQGNNSLWKILEQFETISQ